MNRYQISLRGRLSGLASASARFVIVIVLRASINPRREGKQQLMLTAPKSRWYHPEL
jgi:hypothetical protein